MNSDMQKPNEPDANQAPQNQNADIASQGSDQLNAYAQLPIHEPPQKGKKKLAIIVAILFILLAGAGVAAYLTMDNSDESNVTVEPVEEPTDIYTQIEQIATEATQEHENIARATADNPELEEGQVTANILIKDDESGYVILHTRKDSNVTLALTEESSANSGEEQNKRQLELYEIAATMEQKLEESANTSILYGTSFEGRTIESDSDTTPMSGIVIHENDTHICEIEATYEELSIGCIPKDSMQETVDFAVPLFKAYYEEEGEPETDASTEYGILVVFASQDNIKDATTEGYEVLNTGIGGVEMTEEGIYVPGGGGGGKFYRPVDGDWVYFYGGQAAPDCESLNANDIEIQIYGDEPCYVQNSTNPAQDTTIREYYQ